MQSIKNSMESWQADSCLDVRHVEAWMRIENPTLDALTPREFSLAVRGGMLDAIEAGPVASEKLAQSYGL